MMSVERSFGHDAESPSVRFSLFRSDERADEVLALRKLAFTGRFGPEDLEKGISDPRENRARVVVAEDAGILIGSVRLIPPGPGPLLYPTTRFFGDVGSLAPEAARAEAGWGCVHPKHRGTGLFCRLMEQTISAARAYEAETLILATLRQRCTFWRELGFEETEVSYRGAFSGAEYVVVSIDL